MPDSKLTSQQIRDKQKEFLFPCVITYYKEPLVMAKGQGTRLWDHDGKEYLDFFGGILTVSLGHCEPRVNQRIAQQVLELQHVSTLYPTAQQVTLAERLAHLTPGRLKKCFFTSSGTEADETAVLLAELHTGNQELVVLRHAYAGRSMLAMNITGHAPWRLVASKVATVKHLAAPYCYRCPFGQTYPGCGVRCAKDLEELIKTTTCGRISAFMAEPILGVGGFITPPPEYFQIAVEITRKHGGVFICDEVQTGFGRTGDHWCGIEHYGVEPEIMTFAKGIANGSPMGATIATPEVADSFKGLSISTFGGNPVSDAAALGTIEVMEQEEIPKRSRRLGDKLRAGLEALQKRFDFIGEVRGKGLMQAIELVNSHQTREPAAERTNALMEASKARGLLIGKGGLHGNVLRIAPPMLIDEAALDDGLKRLGESLAAI